MQLRFFTVPIHGPAEQAAELNQFLAGHRILSVDRQLIADGANSAWSLCVSYDASPAATRPPVIGKRPKVDYRELLTPPEFAVFSRLRGLRKEKADAEAVPAYAVFSNEQLLDMVRRRVTTLSALQEIEGVGEARGGKYGDAFLAILRDAALPPPEPPEHEA
jgi:superfamily II DNA helicase RecQ